MLTIRWSGGTSFEWMPTVADTTLAEAIREGQ